jgi:hypothetical protein
MRWFCGVSAEGSHGILYQQLLRVAVHTAQMHTSLVPCVLYDGPENSLTDWLRARRVEVVHCQTYLYDRLKEIAGRKGDANILSIGRGAFLRVEVPKIAAALRIDDECALYTDVDVMFMADVSDALSAMTPTYFAAAPEFTLGDYEHMNSGVMLMNLRQLRTIDSAFRAFIDTRLEKFVDTAWDQEAYRRFFGRRTFVTRIIGTKWDRLEPELNWKPYWGPNPHARIVHFHGPKPGHDDRTFAAGWPESVERMVRQNRETYAYLSGLWRAYLSGQT